MTVDLDTTPNDVGNGLLFTIEIAESAAYFDDAEILAAADAAAATAISGSLGGINIPVKRTATGVAPSASSNTFGSFTTFSPTSPAVYWGPLVGIAVTSGGTFGAETLTVEVRVVDQDSSELNLLLTFTATGQTTYLTMSEIMDLFANGKKLVQFKTRCKSSIGSSAATSGLKVMAYNSGAS